MELLPLLVFILIIGVPSLLIYWRDTQETRKE